LGRNLEKTSPKALEAEIIPVMKPIAVARFDGSTTSAYECQCCVLMPVDDSSRDLIYDFE
jgi:hypothetical protein